MRVSLPSPVPRFSPSGYGTRVWNRGPRLERDLDGIARYSGRLEGREYRVLRTWYMGPVHGKVYCTFAYLCQGSQALAVRGGTGMV